METILVIDDDENQIELTSTYLRMAGYEVQTTTRPLEGIKMVAEKAPDLIICDLMMPEMDGMDVCYHLRNTDEVPFIPFMVLTGLQDARLEETSFSIGADEYLTKPISRADLIDKVNSLIEQTRTFRALEKTGRLEGIIKTAHDHTLLTLFQFLALNHQTGSVEVLGKKASGSVAFSHGTIIDVSFEEKTGLDAMVAIVSLNSGRFRFTAETKNREHRIDESPMNLLMEACRISDEQRLQGN